MPSRPIRRPCVRALVLAAALVGVACDGPTTLGPPEPGEIRGRFVRFDGSPVRDVPIRIGYQQTVTGRDGGFRITGVEPPYDLVVGYPLSGFVYEHVTRNDPIITDPDTRVGYSHAAILNGQVPVAPDLQTLVFVTGASPYAPWRFADVHTGACRMEVTWDGRDESRYTKLYALRRRDAAIVDLAVQPVWFHDRAEHAAVLHSSAFVPVRSFDITGSVRMPAGTQSYVIRMSMSISGTSMKLDARSGSGSVPSFAFTAPVIAGAAFDVDVSTVRAGYSGYSYKQSTHISPQTGPLALQLYNPPTLLNPPAEAVLGDSTAVFSWDVGEGPGMYAFVLSGSQTKVLYTHRRQLSAADTPELAAALLPGHGYFWSVRKVHEASSADELLTSENRATLATSRTTARKFLFR